MRVKAIRNFVGRSFHKKGDIIDNVDTNLAKEWEEIGCAIPYGSDTKKVEPKDFDEEITLKEEKVNVKTKEEKKKKSKKKK